MKIVIVAGEASGDILGAGLMQSLQKLNPHCVFSGIGGAKMQALGFTSLFPLERLSVMGIIEPLKRLPELLHIRKSIKQYCVDNAVDLFIGIDSPDFNLPIEKHLKSQAIKTVHYVSPSVWAWRQGRIKNIKKSVDLMLTLLPFEASFYEEHNVPVKFVGHTLADDIPLEPNTDKAREALDISNQQPVIALMPGSRGGEVALLGPVFLQVAEQIQQRIGNCLFVIPAANELRKQQIIEQLTAYKHLSVKLLDGQSHLAMEASDAVLLASGTTALEAMLLKKPMVVAYKMAPLSYAIISRLVKSPYIALPNLLANTMLVPELLQDDASIENLTQALERALNDKQLREHQIQQFHQLHLHIRCNASQTAAEAIMRLFK
jgi:lipid-A-disaccharide synthase